MFIVIAEYLRKYLQEKWGAKAYDSYGLTAMSAVAAECTKQKGLHVNEIDFLLEVVDLNTGERVEAGEEGELVITTLNCCGMPFLRYQTHDISYLIEEPCECGLCTYRIRRIKKRTDDMVIIGAGANIFPSMFDEALNIEGVLDYQIVIEKEGHKDKIIVRAEA